MVRLPAEIEKGNGVKESNLSNLSVIVWSISLVCLSEMLNPSQIGNLCNLYNYFGC